MTPLTAQTIAALAVAGALVLIALYVWTALALAALFRKAHREPWPAWVPVLNLIALLRLGRVSPWRAWWLVVPGVGAVVVAVFVVIAAHRINARCGVGASMTVLAALCFPLWATALGFGASHWSPDPCPRPRAEADAPRTHPPRPKPVAPVSPRATAHTESDWAPVRSAFAVRDADEPSPPPRVISAAPDLEAVPAAPPSSPPVTRVPSRRSLRRAAEDLALAHAASSDEFDESSDSVSAIAAAPVGGCPRSAASTVSALPPLLADTVAADAADAASDSVKQPLADAAVVHVGMDEDTVGATVVTRRHPTRWLVVADGGEPQGVEADVIILGRVVSSDPAFAGAQSIVITEETVSKTHARLDRRGDAWFVTDLHSTNGVAVAGDDGQMRTVPVGVATPVGTRLFLGDAEIHVIPAVQ